MYLNNEYALLGICILIFDFDFHDKPSINDGMRYVMVFHCGLLVMIISIFFIGGRGVGGGGGGGGVVLNVPF